MRHLAPDTGPAGMEQPLNNFVSEDCSTMKRLMPVTGLKMWLDVKNIVSIFTLFLAYMFMDVLHFSLV